MFGKKQSEPITDSVETVIGPSVKVEGDFIGEGDVIVEGKIVGNLQTNQNLRIGPQALVEAEVKAANAYIAGKINGDVGIVEALEIAASAQINGDISCNNLSIESGAIINGRVTMKKEVNNKSKKVLVEKATETGATEEL